MDAMRSPPGFVLHLSCQLSAGGVDVLAARPAHRRHQAGFLQDVLEGEDPGA
jgi:hypothetical protein